MLRLRFPSNDYYDFAIESMTIRQAKTKTKTLFAVVIKRQAETYSHTYIYYMYTWPYICIYMTSFAPSYRCSAF